VFLFTLLQASYLGSLREICGKDIGFEQRLSWRTCIGGSGAATVGEKQVSSPKQAGHNVRYSGHLDLEPMCIAGRWISYGRILGWILPPRDWGSLELYQKSDGRIASESTTAFVGVSGQSPEPWLALA
jgi:hypothetical protein